MITSQADCSFIARGENIIITGATVCVKSYLASPLGYQACSKGKRVAYFSLPKLLDWMIHQAHRIELKGESLCKITKIYAGWEDTRNTFEQVWETRIILSNYFPFPTTTRLWCWLILIIKLTSPVTWMGSSTQPIRYQGSHKAHLYHNSI